MRIKVCGMKNRENIEQLIRLNPDYVGFIFHPLSKRYAGEVLQQDIAELIPKNIQKVGIFVDESLNSLSEKYFKIQLNLVQLHGNEKPEYCKALKEEGIQVIKAFRVGKHFDFAETIRYESCSDFFLFDTAGEKAGGNGIKFDWNILKIYDGGIPFFLSGGICPSDTEKIKALSNTYLYGVDINSGFESEPGIKNISDIAIFIEELRSTTLSKS